MSRKDGSSMRVIVCDSFWYRDGILCFGPWLGDVLELVFLVWGLVLVLLAQKQVRAWISACLRGREEDG